MTVFVHQKTTFQQPPPPINKWIRKQSRLTQVYLKHSHDEMPDQPMWLCWPFWVPSGQSSLNIMSGQYSAFCQAFMCRTFAHFDLARHLVWQCSWLDLDNIVQPPKWQRWGDKTYQYDRHSNSYVPSFQQHLIIYAYQLTIADLWLFRLYICAVITAMAPANP